MNIYISSVENGSGKTIITAGIAAVLQSLGYKTGVYKPVQTGAIDKGSYLVSPDLAFIKMVDPHIKTHSTYMMKTSAIPAIAAKEESTNIIFDNIQNDYEQLDTTTDILFVEANGGLMTPIKNRLFAFNIPQNLNLPILFVITPNENTVNYYLNELNTAKALNLDVAGVIINKFSVYSSDAQTKFFPEIIEKYTDVKILGLIRNFEGKSISTTTLINEILNGIDLEELLKMKIPKLNGI